VKIRKENADLSILHEKELAKRSNVKPNKIFYFRVVYPKDYDHDKPVVHCDILDNRNTINDVLSVYSFKHLDSTGGQSAFKPRGLFDVFKFIVELTAKENNINITDIKHCDDPGLGLFWS
jgi:hypothetical protein